MYKFVSQLLRPAVGVITLHTLNQVSNYVVKVCVAIGRGGLLVVWGCVRKLAPAVSWRFRLVLLISKQECLRVFRLQMWRRLLALERL